MLEAQSKGVSNDHRLNCPNTRHFDPSVYFSRQSFLTKLEPFVDVYLIGFHYFLYTVSFSVRPPTWRLVRRPYGAIRPRDMQIEDGLAVGFVLGMKYQWARQRASKAAADSGEFFRVAANTSDHRVGEKIRGALLDEVRLLMGISYPHELPETRWLLQKKCEKLPRSSAIDNRLNHLPAVNVRF